MIFPVSTHSIDFSNGEGTYVDFSMCEGISVVFCKYEGISFDFSKGNAFRNF